MLLTTYGTEWPILYWCTVKKLLTHSLTHSLTQSVQWLVKQKSGLDAHVMQELFEIVR